MKTATALISVSGTGHVSIFMNEGETKDDLLKLTDSELADRIIDWMDVVDNCLDENDVDFDDITVNDKP